VYLPDFELHEATTLEDAVTKVSRYAPHSRLLAGGTDLLVDLKTARVSFNHLVSLNRLDALRGVSEIGGGMRIGALTTVSELGRSSAVRERFAAILDATTRMAAVQIRNVATVGGNIASAVPCADLPPILTVLNASVVLWSPAGQRNVPLEAFFTGPRQTILRPSEILTAVHVPRIPPGFGAAYARFGLRDGNTIAVAAVAASLQLHADGTVKNVRIVLGAVAPIPKLVGSAGTELIGRLPDDGAFDHVADLAMKAAEPISDVRGSADFRRELVRVLTKRALATAYQRGGGAF
jgi:carbon-monoxide dehydrogenase medium subunit